MKLSFARVTLGVTLVAALLTFAQVTQAHECAVSDAAGRYGCTSTGTMVNPPIGPFTAIGHVRFTETETLSGAQTTSIAGNLVDEILQGTTKRAIFLTPGTNISILARKMAEED